GFELGSEMSSLSFHMSDFGVICPSQTSQSFNKTLAPFCGTTSLLSRLQVICGNSIWILQQSISMLQP
ncbi:MAG: hypothetical protein ACK5VX_00035, partial [Akkermansiaceae bacterium]